MIGCGRDNYYGSSFLVMALTSREELLMMRPFLGVTIALLICAGTGLAQKKTKGVFTGTLKKADAETGVVIVSITDKKLKEKKDMEFKVGDDTKIVLLGGEEKEEYTGKAALKNKLVKEGATTSVFTDADGKVTEVRVLGVPMKKN